MANGAKLGKRCQWQELYLIGYSVVRLDKEMLYQDLARIDWNDIYNTLVRSWYLIFKTQSIVKPEEAINPNAKLTDGWKWDRVELNTFPITVAYREIVSAPGFYEVSFVIFTKWNANIIAQTVKSFKNTFN